MSGWMPSRDNGGRSSNSGTPMSNPFANIGTPIFNMSQIPQHILQNLTPQQLQLIQQRHQQLLRARMQQTQQGDYMGDINGPNSNGSRGPGGSSQPSPATSIQVPQDTRSGTATPMPFTLPPQIAQLPLPTQQQLLNSLKQQAIARNNPSAVAAITMTQQQIQQQLQQQMQLQQQQMFQQQQQMPTFSPQDQGQTPMQQMQSQALPPQQQQQQLAASQRQSFGLHVGTPGSTVSATESTVNIQDPTMAAAGSMAPTPIPNQPTPAMPKFELPKYQIIDYDPPETRLPYSNYWSDQDARTDTLLYEQMIERDKANRIELMKETNGYEPFSIYGFSNKEYLGKLWHTLKYYQDLKATRMKTITNTAQNMPSASIWGNGYSGYNNGNSNTVTRVVPGDLPDNRQPIYQDKIALYNQAINEESEDLVPIRLEFDSEKDKFLLRDTLLWNKNDALVDINDFVNDMVRDYKFDDLIKNQVGEVIMQSMKEQISDFQPNPYQETAKERLGGDDIRVTIKLDIVMGQNRLVDHIEWDISNNDNSPEEFAECMCQELQLPGEFVTAIAHTIREQVHMYHKSLMLVGYRFDGSVVEDDDIRSRILPVVTVDNIYRNPADAKIYTPNLLAISNAELERLDKDKDRDSRRKRRQGRFNRRGVNTTNVGGSTASFAFSHGTGSGTNLGSASPAPGALEASLPDVSDIPRTFRTPVPSTVLPGGIDLGPSVESYELKTSVKYVARPERPKPKMPPCYVIDHVPGSSLLLSITVPSRKSAPAPPPPPPLSSSSSEKPAIKTEGSQAAITGNVASKTPSKTSEYTTQPEQALPQVAGKTTTADL